ncbi:hypothetical protein RZS28_05510 [Methylocapsa polymorpha]|uniref:Uncharacterized protein n=1 Tax=Methylocapsa polymorpha TaxID=3080828 RepID=A0ABZ0HTZ5_9HYPH|nr:hypothetical protein RZS28_05510 [Methylocapsa sp. RX1]
MKDVGGLVTDYQAQTEIYRLSDREVRLHECRSACTMALSLPNVCVYPDSILKFHQAYDVRNHQTDLNVSQQLFDSYPAAVRARLGGLTREYKVLRGNELIELGVRNCNEERTMVAATTPRKTPPMRSHAEPQPAEQGSFFAGLMDKMRSAFGTGERTFPPGDRTVMARANAPKSMSSESLLPEPPLPPARPTEIASMLGAPTEHDAIEAAAPADIQTTDAQTTDAQTADAPLPPARPTRLTYSYTYRLASIALPKIITGAQRILPPGFRAYAPLER